MGFDPEALEALEVITNYAARFRLMRRAQGFVQSYSIIVLADSKLMILRLKMCLPTLCSTSFRREQ